MSMAAYWLISENNLSSMRLSRALGIFLALPLLAGVAGCSGLYEINVANPLPQDRVSEMVEVPMDRISKAGKQSFVLCSEDGAEVAYQLTSDNLMVFQASVPGGGKVSYRLVKGTPAPVDTVACGSHRPDRLDDFIWENDKSGYRTYGPKLQAKGERGYGFDVFTKSVRVPVMKARFDAASRGKSYHVDHGDGMDAYGVGPTLGCGAPALIRNGEIVYPWAWKSFEVLDNGPLRFRIRLEYSPVIVDGKAVVETRVITLDAGSYLNKAEVSYSGLGNDADVGVGIVVHKDNPEAYELGDTFMGYADLGDKNIGGNGEIYCGVVFSEAPESVSFRPFDNYDALMKNRRQGLAVGHVIGVSDYHAGKVFEYYFGSGWSKGGVESLDSWAKYLEDFSSRLREPLRITVKH